jgi:hypothetical protein
MGVDSESSQAPRSIDCCASSSHGMTVRDEHSEWLGVHELGVMNWGFGSIVLGYTS